MGGRRAFLKAVVGAAFAVALGLGTKGLASSSLLSRSARASAVFPIVNGTPEAMGGRFGRLPTTLDESQATQVFPYPYRLHTIALAALQTTWYMFFAHGTPLDAGPKAIGLAKSVDKGQTWTVIQDHLLDPVPGTWEGDILLPDCLVFLGDRYRLYYSGATGPDWMVGVAEADDIEGPYIRHPSNPVLGPNPGAWDQGPIFDAQVVWFRGQFHMYYAASGVYGVGWQTGHATGPDGLSWNRDPANPIIAEGSGWRQNGCFVTDVLAPYGPGLLLLTNGDNYGPPRTMTLGRFATDDGSAVTEGPSNPILGILGDGNLRLHPRSVVDGNVLHLFYPLDSAATPDRPVYRLAVPLAP